MFKVSKSVDNKSIFDKLIILHRRALNFKNKFTSFQKKRKLNKFFCHRSVRLCHQSVLFNKVKVRHFSTLMTFVRNHGFFKLCVTLRTFIRMTTHTWQEESGAKRVRDSI